MFVETGRDRKSGIVASQRANFYCNPIPIRVLVEPLRRKQSDRNRERRKILRGGKKHCWEAGDSDKDEVYYENVETGEAVWKLPDDGDLVES